MECLAERIKKKLSKDLSSTLYIFLHSFVKIFNAYLYACKIYACNRSYVIFFSSHGIQDFRFPVWVVGNPNRYTEQQILDRLLPAAGHHEQERPQKLIKKSHEEQMALLVVSKTNFTISSPLLTYTFKGRSML